MDKETVKKLIWQNNHRASNLDGPFVLMDNKYVIKITNNKKKDISGSYDFLAVVFDLDGLNRVRFVAHQDAPALLSKSAKKPYVARFFRVIPS